jgi:phosphatidate phosphatase APP1
VGDLKDCYCDLYVSYGHSGSGLAVRGRVLEGKRPALGSAETGTFGRLRASWQLLETDEIAGVEVAVELLVPNEPPRRGVAGTDKEGFFRVRFEGPLPPGTWPLRATLSGKPLRAEPVEGRALVHSNEPGIGVISDIDDTVLLTGVRDQFGKVGLIKRVLLSTPESMETFDGAADLYQRLVAAGAPLVFVSSSPWNLEPRLRSFFDLQKFPIAPMLLKDLGVGPEADSLFDHEAYKARCIEEVMATLPARRFLLVGDSGEHDPEIYGRIARERPDRVAGVYIRRVLEEPLDSARFAGAYVFDRYDDAARDMKRRGFID